MATVYPRHSRYLEADRLMTVTMLFLDKYSGTYRTRGVLRAKIENYLDNEYESDLKWLDREKDMDLLVDSVTAAGSVVIVELPPLPKAGGGEMKAVEENAENEGREGKILS